MQIQITIILEFVPQILNLLIKSWAVTFDAIPRVYKQSQETLTLYDIG